MNRADIENLATRPDAWRNGPWWEREAAHAFARGDFLLIPGRKDADVYLARFWLSAAVRRPSGDQGGEAIASGESLLLHFFARGDDDESLHDHPWDFRTTILAGGYYEHLPPPDWQGGGLDDGPGPAWDKYGAHRFSGVTLCHRATDLHCVGCVAENTWTLVRTGRRVREWGFHPPGHRWVGYRDFLKLTATTATA